jgi:hypothetical protein
MHDLDLYEVADTGFMAPTITDLGQRLHALGKSRALLSPGPCVLQVFGLPADFLSPFHEVCDGFNSHPDLTASPGTSLRVSLPCPACVRLVLHVFFWDVLLGPKHGRAVTSGDLLVARVTPSNNRRFEASVSTPAYSATISMVALVLSFTADRSQS